MALFVCPEIWPFFDQIIVLEMCFSRLKAIQIWFLTILSHLQQKYLSFYVQAFAVKTFPLQ
jgi:hypothetical protein